MFYVRKPTDDVVASIIREASAAELHNYKNKFVLVDTPGVNTSPGCNLDDLFFININCDLNLDNLGSNT